MADKQSIIPTLQAIRAKLNLTQEQLSKRLGVSFTTVNRWEGGVTKPQKAARTAIAAWLVRRASTPLNWLLTSPPPA